MEITNATQLYAKHYIPLESDPSVLNDLMYGLGVSGSLTLTDVWEINDSIQLSLIPRPVLALILVLPTSEKYETHRRSANVSTDTAEDPKQESVVWFRQTINNACGLYAILHAICNIENRGFIGTSRHKNQVIFSLTPSGRIEPGSFLSHLCARSTCEQEDLLNSSTDLDAIYEKAALRGTTAPPPAHDEVDLHYVCFVKSSNGSVYEMDGDTSGPVKTNITLKHDEDMLVVSALECVRHCVAREDNDGLFSLLALVPGSGSSD